jgi:hypothetical protein
VLAKLVRADGKYDLLVESARAAFLVVQEAQSSMVSCSVTPMEKHLMMMLGKKMT